MAHFECGFATAAGAYDWIMSLCAAMAATTGVQLMLMLPLLFVFLSVVCGCCMLQVCKYIDMPLQHINNLTLLAMNRPPQAHTKALLHKLRDNIPGLVLRTTFISGGQQHAARACHGSSHNCGGCAHGAAPAVGGVLSCTLGSCQTQDAPMTVAGFMVVLLMREPLQTACGGP
jgi:hypothetical protein